MIDLREYDQREHGTHQDALTHELLEPEQDQELVDYIAASLALQRDRRQRAERERKEARPDGQGGAANG